MEGVELIPFVPEVPQTFHQLGILVLDGSSSMGGAKARQVDGAVNALFDRMNRSRVKNNFSFACVVFSDSPTTLFPATRFVDLNYRSINFNPYYHKGGGTHIYEALATAGDMARDFLRGAESDDLPHSAVILLMSDGMCAKPEITKSIAAKIKEYGRVVIACAYFSGGVEDHNASAAINLLQEIASAPSFYATVHDGETLRRFFERSISQSSGVKIDKVE